MNTLANHGYLPRDGSSFTLPQIRKVFKEVFSIGEDVADFFFNTSIDQGLNDTVTKDTLSLGSINRFGAISHDVSLVRDDRALTQNEFAINQTLVNQFANKATNGNSITFGQFAQYALKIHADETDNLNLAHKNSFWHLAKLPYFT
jgi:hypothetical protein